MPSKVKLTTIAEMIADPLLAAIPLFPKPESRNNTGVGPDLFLAHARAVLTRRAGRADVPGGARNATVFDDTRHINQRPGGRR
jgi:hypothetical protein